MTTAGDDNNNFQRSGSVSNAHVGREFEAMAKKYFRREYPDHPELQEEFAVDIGLSNKKEKRFDLGAANPAILVECKSHTWTRGGNVPSAKIAVWNETMYYFHLAPKASARFCSYSVKSTRETERVWVSITSSITDL